MDNLLHCILHESYGGVNARLWYALASDFGKFILPDKSDYKNSRVIQKNNISLKKYKSLKCVDLFLDQNSLLEKKEGMKRALKEVAELRIVIINNSSRNLAFKTAIINEPLIVFIRDNNGILWIFGTPKNPAIVVNGEGDSGREIMEDSKIEITLEAKTHLYEYNGNIGDIKVLGAFSSGFSYGFNRV